MCLCGGGCKWSVFFFFSDVDVIKPKAVFQKWKINLSINLSLMSAHLIQCGNNLHFSCQKVHDFFLT